MAPSGIARSRFSSMTDARLSRRRPRGEHGENEQHDGSRHPDCDHADEPRHAFPPDDRDGSDGPQRGERSDADRDSSTSWSAPSRNLRSSDRPADVARSITSTRA